MTVFVLWSQNSFFNRLKNMTYVNFPNSFYDFNLRPFQFIPRLAISNMLMEFSGMSIAAIKGDKLP
jgi:hypothetical protein